MQDRETRPALHRRTLLIGVGGLTVAAAAAGCGGEEPSTAAAGTALGPTADVPVGSGKVYAEQRVVVTQPVQGTFHAFSAVCTHQGCTLQDVSDGTINCACHGSRFAIDDGSVSRGPAQEPLARRAVAVEAEWLTLR
ncbi:MAG: Rieske (2Fe-2S) domain protein [uncultured Friedmanniella sp.]|uniref:Cytochrome bc1 complex Rieske iron-sulfur subunit n=1 Tax=uncultured Friedmanniella sp. TaxID=335381 RepID=A0A6J4L816_9ACTN|nr:Rieske (2Fe-2S) protein [uncultured Friedmanniella sp.]CAA9325246.1 MAG: Rieske (2Fe-2S) domain protein [uncultured Friedmanniella sp.]